MERSTEKTERETIIPVLQEVYCSFLPLIRGGVVPEFPLLLSVTKMCDPARKLMAIEIIKKTSLPVRGAKGPVFQEGFCPMIVQGRAHPVFEHGVIIVGPLTNNEFLVVDPTIQMSINHWSHEGLFVSRPLKEGEIGDFLAEQYRVFFEGAPSPWEIDKEPYSLESLEEEADQMIEQIGQQREENQKVWEWVKKIFLEI